ncbi:uncharacterized protein PG998_000676 [Apiospora kogelbergensis]|uniref:uncharacterized protein n=1 Tax=Apiospora kogelbergensis TaxID=1337665 RepID=UPI00312DFC7C
MAAQQQPRDPLDVLHQAFNEYLVSTGKALKTSHRNGPRSVASTAGAIKSKVTDTMTAYNCALDDLESEITRAKAVLLRDLEKLQAARMPVPEPTPPPPPQPVAPPAPMMEDAKQPAAVMLEMPSTAAHTVNPNMGGFEVKEETKRVAPFPDMGMGLAADVVDLTSGGGDSPKPTPPVSTKAVPAPATKAIPTPQQQQHQPAPAVAPVAAAPDDSMDVLMSIPPPSAGPTGGVAMADMTGGELNFTNMEFTLAPTPTEGQNAPPAPMQDFDLSSFATQGGGGNDLLAMDSFGTGPGDASAGGASGSAMATGGGAAGNSNSNNNAAAAPPQNTAAAAAAALAPPPQAPATAEDTSADSANIDSLFDLGSAGGDNMDLDLNLSDAGGMGGMGENSFNDLFMPDGDMDQFDEQYFQLE